MRGLIVDASIVYPFLQRDVREFMIAKRWKTTYRGDVALHHNGNLIATGTLVDVFPVDDGFMWAFSNVATIDPLPCRGKPGLWQIRWSDTERISTADEKYVPV